MKNKFQKHLMVILSLAFLIGGCSLGKYFSDGYDSLKRAETAWSKGDQVEALFQVSQAIRLDGELDEAKIFLKDKFFPAMQKIDSELSQTKNSSKLADLERRVYLYEKLDAFSSNLRQINLPLKGEVDDKPWEWTTQIEDYTGRLDRARTKAFKAFYAHGRKLLMKHEVTRAEVAFSKAINNYSKPGTTQKDETKAKASNEFNAYAKKYHKSSKIKTLLRALNAYKVSLRFVLNNNLAVTGTETIKKRLSVVYYNQGWRKEKGKSKNLKSLTLALKDYEESVKWDSTNAKANAAIPRVKGKISDIYYFAGKKKEKKKKLQSLKLALKDYEESLKWNPANQKSTDSIPRVKGKIAEVHYQKAKRLEKSNKNAAIESYKLAVKWVPGYKDSVRRVSDLLMGNELEKLVKNINNGEKEVNSIGNNPHQLLEKTAKAADTMAKITQFSDKARNLNTRLGQINSTLASFSRIPTVGVVTKTASVVVVRAKKPIQKTVKKLNKIERPVITPLKNSIEKLRTVTAQVESKVKAIADAYARSRTAISTIKAGAENLNQIDRLEKLSGKAKNINKAMAAVNKVLHGTNITINRVKSSVAKVAKVQPIASKVANSIKKLDTPINKIGKVANKIDSTLKKKVGIKVPAGLKRKGFKVKVKMKRVEFSVKKILTGGPKIVKKFKKLFNNAVAKVLDPVLKGLKVRIPEVKGLSKINKEIEHFKNRHNVIKAKVAQLKSQLTDLNRYERMISDNLREAESLAR